ncbi:MAG: hypothetical protein O3A10_13550 [Chloroflexi bacterium]|nr:hypothetical protein [Chloroflexota bacterium]MDA1147932.1 hypothetical protein [Chloroflexota bacterium]
MKRLMAATGIAAALFLSAAGVASADQDNGEGAFLCPVVGQGAANAPGLAGKTLTLPGGETSFLPGKNKAGLHANANALNENGGPAVGNVPGADGFTPIWNP